MKKGVKKRKIVEKTVTENCHIETIEKKVVVMRWKEFIHKAKAKGNKT